MKWQSSLYVDNNSAEMLAVLCRSVVSALLLLFDVLLLMKKRPPWYVLADQCLFVPNETSSSVTVNPGQINRGLFLNKRIWFALDTAVV